MTTLIRSPKDFWAGLIYLFFGASAVILAWDYPMGTALRMGPAYFPSLLGYLLAAIGIVSIVRSFLAHGAKLDAFTLRGLVLVIVSVLLFGWLVRRLGLVFALPLLILTSAYASTHFRWRSTILMAAGLTAFCAIVFLRGLGVPLPLIGSWLGG